MASSDDEEEALPEVVTNYHFEDKDAEPISFISLPLHWDGESESLDGTKDTVYLRGLADNGLRKIYMAIKCWKMDLLKVNPEIWVLSKDNSWLKLEKPRKSFENTIRSVLITVNCLHYLKRNPNASAKSLWDHLNKAFSLYDPGPSARDLANHVTLISRAMKMDNDFSNCKFLISFLEDKPWKKKILGQESVAKPAFVVEDTEDHTMDDTEDDSDEDGEEDEEEDKGVCAFCDNGGKMTCCDGKCLRKFHANQAHVDEDTVCETLGLSKAQLEAPSFLCKNCIYKQHQCFICGKLGSSDKSSVAEVFQCITATCGYFYHPHCVAKWFHPKDEVARKELQGKIAEGESFTCPIHSCRVCNKRENKDIEDLQFAECRRCPTAYHRKCLPKEILFEETDDMPVRAWENLLPDNHILIYCSKHEIVEELGTPARGHIIFPPEGESRSAVGEKRKRSPESLSSRGEVPKKKHLSKSDFLGSNAVKKLTDKVKKSAVAAKDIGKGENVRSSLGNDKARKVSHVDTSKKSQKNPQKSGSFKVESSSKVKERSPTLGKRLYDYMDERLGQVKPGKRSGFESKESSKIDIDMKNLGSLPSLDSDSERRLLQLIKDAEFSVSMDDVKRKQNVPSTHTQQLKSFVEKNITCGKVEGAVEAIRSAVKKIESGSSVEDAQAVCEPKVLTELLKWKDKLKVYLAPFLYGMRYTSFGRHFTKVEKLQEIVDKLHWYIKDGDMIVDFCCGANDFSCLMANKLKETGKKCSFKNYDCLQAKNDFHFERRDWMTVGKNELPKGSKLVMGLNPPFGVKAALANKFINKALEFKPKLIILIVPPETERLDKKKNPYDLVWEEDGHFLSGKSFYLPGSIDVNDQQMDQWNLTPPLLYLWSRRDFTVDHRLIAEKQGHLRKQEESLHLDKPIDNRNSGDAPSSLTDSILARTERAEINDNPALAEGIFFRNNSGKGSQEGLGYLGNQPNGTSRKGELGKEKHAIGKASIAINSREDRPPSDEMPRETPVSRSPSITDKKSSFASGSLRSHDMPLDEMPRETPVSRSPSVTDKKSSFGSGSLRSHDMPIDVGSGNGNNQHNDLSVSGSRKEFDMIYGEVNPNEIDRRYGLNNGNYYSHQRYADSGITGSYYGPRDLDGQDRRYAGRVRENLNNPGFDGIDNYLRDYDRRGQAHTYGQPGSDMSRGSYLPAHDLGYDHMGLASPSYVLHGPAPGSSYSMSTSALQRYPSPLDEMNPPRVNILGSDPHIYSRNQFSDPGPPPPAHHGGPLGFRASQPDSQDVSMGFAPGPMRLYTRRNSSGGWLYE